MKKSLIYFSIGLVLILSSLAYVFYNLDATSLYSYIPALLGELIMIYSIYLIDKGE
jgi:hypothetical protein